MACNDPITRRRWKRFDLCVVCERELLDATPGIEPQPDRIRKHITAYRKMRERIGEMMP
jgi:hypothetical protein